MKIQEEIGKKYGRLTIIELAETVEYFYKWKTHQYVMKCICDCGKEARVNLNSMRRGRSTSCGCYNSEYQKQAKKKHGLCLNEDGSRKSEYSIWTKMKSRCQNPDNKNYHHYGGRGIVICDRWSGREGFINFYTDMGEKPGPKHSIDRIDNDGPYSPENCRWATWSEQQRNKRTNISITYNGKTQTMVEWAEELNLEYPMLRYRIVDQKWPVF